MSAISIIELGFVYLYMTVMRKWFKKNEKALTKIGTIFFILNFIDFFTFTIEGNIISTIICLLYTYDAADE